MKFAHLADCHLGGWRQQELQELNFKSFQRALEISLNENVDFILISGDLFDSAYPPIEILKETFAEFKKIHDSKVPVFIIAGSHDFSASGKTFLDVLERAGFCKNVENFELVEDKIKLKPTIFKDIALFGYSGKKSGMELKDLEKINLESMHPQSILMLHTTIEDVCGGIMESINTSKLPLANYYALGHIHQVFQKQEKNAFFVYPGPIFPNNFQELADLECGSFQLVNFENGKIKSENIKLKLKDVVYLEISLENAFSATDRIISELDKLSLKDKIVLLKLKGLLTQGKTGDIRFEEIDAFVKKKEAHSFIRNTSSLEMKESEITIEAETIENIEEKIIEDYSSLDKAEFSKILPRIVDALAIEKNEDEKAIIFENRLLGELKKILKLEGVL